jgi:hypothetical protein
MPPVDGTKNLARELHKNGGMTLPLEVNFWNMPPEPSLEAAARDELCSLKPDEPLTSCRVSVRRSKAGSTEPRYDVQVVVLAGPKMLRAGCDSPWSRLLRHAVAPWSQSVEPDTAAAALHRAFAKIHAQLH